MSDMAPHDDDLDPVARTMLELLRAGKPGASITAEVVARAVADARARPADPPDLWRRYMNAVKQQALHLARVDRLVVVRKGRVIAPDEIKGVVRYRLPD